MASNRSKAPEERRTYVVQLAVSREEWRVFEGAARRAGRPIARVVREVALRAIRAEVAASARCCP